jgi:hypothetical protein
LLGGMALGMLLGTVATVELNVRFLVPTIPLLVCAGVLALLDLCNRPAWLAARDLVTA